MLTLGGYIAVGKIQKVRKNSMSTDIRNMEKKSVLEFLLWKELLEKKWMVCPTEMDLN